MSPLKRRHSWPPFQLAPFSHRANKDIDEDPFAFFISDQDDDEGYVSDYMNANIEITPPRPRSSSPFKTRKRRRQSSGEHTTAIFLLRRWLKRMETQYFGRHRTSPEIDFVEPVTPDSLPQPFSISPTLPAYRGRNSLRKTSLDVSTHGQVRSHSLKPRIWREPAYDIWTVAEEQEEGAGLGISV